MEGGYRAIDHYVAEASDRHLRAGFESLELLKKTMKGSVRAATRGQGPPTQSEAFDVDEFVGKHVIVEKPAIIGGPVFALAYGGAWGLLLTPGGGALGD